MGRQELAESMADFLGYVVEDGLCMNLITITEDINFDKFIFSPMGFIAVLDEFNPMTVIFHNTEVFDDPDKKVRCILHDSLDKKRVEEYGSARDTALYSAIHEMRKK